MRIITKPLWFPLWFLITVNLALLLTFSSPGGSEIIIISRRIELRFLESNILRFLGSLTIVAVNAIDSMVRFIQSGPILTRTSWDPLHGGLIPFTCTSWIAGIFNQLQIYSLSWVQLVNYSDVLGSVMTYCMECLYLLFYYEQWILSKL